VSKVKDFAAQLHHIGEINLPRSDCSSTTRDHSGTARSGSAGLVVRVRGADGGKSTRRKLVIYI